MPGVYVGRRGPRVSPGCLGLFILLPLLFVRLLVALVPVVFMVGVVAMAVAVWTVVGISISVDWVLRKLPPYRQRRESKPLTWPTAGARAAADMVQDAGRRASRR